MATAKMKEEYPINDHPYSRHSHSHQPLPSPRALPSHIHPAPSPSHSQHTHSHPPPQVLDRTYDRHSANMTRHDSYQFGSSSTQPRAPPPLRSVQSYADSPTSSNKRSADKDDPDELTTKGRKRKRLAKACSACHVSLSVFCASRYEDKDRADGARKTSADATALHLAPTANSPPALASISTLMGSRSHRHARATHPIRPPLLLGSVKTARKRLPSPARLPVMATVGWPMRWTQWTMILT